MSLGRNASAGNCIRRVHLVALAILLSACDGQAPPPVPGTEVTPTATAAGSAQAGTTPGQAVTTPSQVEKPVANTATPGQAGKPATNTTTATAGTVPTPTEKPRFGSIRVTVTRSSDRSPVSGADILVDDNPTGKTGSDGIHTISDVEPGDHIIRALTQRDEASNSEERMVNAGGPPVQVALVINMAVPRQAPAPQGPVGVVTGRVIEPVEDRLWLVPRPGPAGVPRNLGVPVADAEIFVDGAQSPSTTTNQSGMFTVRLAPGVHTLRASSRTLRASSDTETVNLLPSVGATVDLEIRKPTRPIIRPGGSPQVTIPASPARVEPASPKPTATRPGPSPSPAVSR